MRSSARKGWSKAGSKRSKPADLKSNQSDDDELNSAILPRTRGMKKRRLNEEIDQREGKELERDFEDWANTNNRFGFVVDVTAPSEASYSGRPSAMTNRQMEPISGASVLKYELVEKQSKKVLLAKRCSLRHRKPEEVQ